MPDSVTVPPGLTVVGLAENDAKEREPTEKLVVVVVPSTVTVIVNVPAVDPVVNVKAI